MTQKLFGPLDSVAVIYAYVCLSANKQWTDCQQMTSMFNNTPVMSAMQKNIKDNVQKLLIWVVSRVFLMSLLLTYSWISTSKTIYYSRY